MDDWLFNQLTDDRYAYRVRVSPSGAWSQLQVFLCFSRIMIFSIDYRNSVFRLFAQLRRWISISRIHRWSSLAIVWKTNNQLSFTHFHLFTFFALDSITFIIIGVIGGIAVLAGKKIRLEKILYLRFLNNFDCSDYRCSCLRDQTTLAEWWWSRKVCSAFDITNVVWIYIFVCSYTPATAQQPVSLLFIVCLLLLFVKYFLIFTACIISWTSKSIISNSFLKQNH